MVGNPFVPPTREFIEYKLANPSPCLVINGATYCYNHLKIRCQLCTVDFTDLNESRSELRRKEGILRPVGDAMLNTLSNHGMMGYTGAPTELIAQYAHFCAYFDCPDPSGKKTKRKLGLCTKCRKVKYCSRECQMKDWQSEHKPYCLTKGMAK